MLWAVSLFLKIVQVNQSVSQWALQRMLVSISKREKYFTIKSYWRDMSACICHNLFCQMRMNLNGPYLVFVLPIDLALMMSNIWFAVSCVLLTRWITPVFLPTSCRASIEYSWWHGAPTEPELDSRSTLLVQFRASSKLSLVQSPQLPEQYLLIIKLGDNLSVILRLLLT